MKVYAGVPGENKKNINSFVPFPLSSHIFLCIGINKVNPLSDTLFSFVFCRLTFDSVFIDYPEAFEFMDGIPSQICALCVCIHSNNLGK